MRHTRLPLYAILGAVLIIAAWAYSFCKGTYFECPLSRHFWIGFGTDTGEIRIWAGNPNTNSDFIRPVFGSTSARFWQDSLSPGDREIDLTPIHWHITDRPELEVNYYLILILYTAFWLTLLTRLSRRRKSHPTPPLPNRAE
jgi:hypothetical protein